MRILVTGSEGSLMQWTIDHLLDEGHSVVGADNYVRYDEEGYEATKVVDGYDFEQADLTDLDRVRALASEVDAVLHGAGLIYGVKGFHEHPADILDNDVTITRNVTRAARENDLDRVVFISSSMVYERGESPQVEEDVDDLPIPSTDYGLSKVVGERFCRANSRQYGIDYTIWRPFNIITPFEIAEDEPGMSHVFADFMRKILIENQNPMEIFGDGEQIRCFTWIEDVAAAIAKTSFISETQNETFNLANPEPVTMKELAQQIFAKGCERGLVEGQELEFDHKPIYDDDVRERNPSVSKAEEEIAWEPRVKLDEALDRCIDQLITHRSALNTSR